MTTLRQLLAEADERPWELAEDDPIPHMRFGGRDMYGTAVGPDNGRLIVWLVNHADTLADLIDAAKKVRTMTGSRQDECWAALDAVLARLEGTE